MRTLCVPIVSVVWTDAVFDVNEIPATQDMCTVGVLVSKTTNSVSVAHEFCVENHALTYRGTTTIPRKMVRRIITVARNKVLVA